MTGHHQENWAESLSRNLTDAEVPLKLLPYVQDAEVPLRLLPYVQDAEAAP